MFMFYWAGFESHCSHPGPRREGDLDFLPSVVRLCELVQ